LCPITVTLKSALPRTALIDIMHYREFIETLGQQECPAGLDPCLAALWHDARGDWDRAHAIVQSLDSRSAARIHAYLHRKEGDDWNARYWHRHAGTECPAGMSLADEWDTLVRALLV
jgi:hypothetical protein